MTECERIIKKGVLPTDFLNPEVKCDFLVDEKRKKLWAVSLDLLLELDRVCKKHNLKYFLMGGTLIGAIRHDGFIPWDDDIDVAMLREDYEKLLEIGPAEFNEPYFFQTPETDENYYFSFAKLRNSNTSGISYAFRYEKFNQGIFLDIFPLDNCLLGDLEDRFDKINKLVADNSTYMRMSNPNPSESDKERIATHSGRNPMDVYNEIQEIAMQYKDIETEYISTAVLTAYKYDTLLYKKSWFDEIIYKDFEGLRFPIPKMYDEALRVQYGDYMQLPPKEQRGNWHSQTVFEPDVPYKEFIKTLQN